MSQSREWNNRIHGLKASCSYINKKSIMTLSSWSYIHNYHNHRYVQKRQRVHVMYRAATNTSLKSETKNREEVEDPAKV